MSDNVPPLNPANLTHGNCTFTVENPQGQRYTLRVKASKPNERFPVPALFVSYLTGSENDNDNCYSYLGMMRNGALIQTAKSPATDHIVFRVAAWSLRAIVQRLNMPEGYRIIPSGRCCRCGRMLTVPSSVDANIGPECAGKIGL